MRWSRIPPAERRARGQPWFGRTRRLCEPAENLVRVLAMHHHPLPQATGEGKRFLGSPDEPLMYLAAPATFLEAATSLNVNLVLHGHRHVEGLARYSIPDPRASRSGGEDFWRTIYVLSCPSSTGQAGDDAGFNIIHFGPMSGAGRPEYRFAIARYSRPRNDSGFRPLEFESGGRVIGLAGGAGSFPRSRLPVGDRDRLMRVSEAGSGAALARRLLSRRAFYDDGEAGWADILYIYLVTSHAWADLEGKLREVGTAVLISRRWRQWGPAPSVDRAIRRVLGIDRVQLDELRANRLINREGLRRRWPKRRARLRCRGRDAAAAAIAAGPERASEGARPRSGPRRRGAAADAAVTVGRPH